MLDVAINHTEELKSKFFSIWFKERYKYWVNSNYYEEFEIAKNTWNNHQFVSMRDDKIIGYIGYSLDRASDFVCGLSIINFEGKASWTFSIDLGNALVDIFEKYNFRKLCFSVVVGNSIEKTYDKLCKKYGGRIVGVQREHTRLIDGKFCDEKLYEILREDYNGRNK